jgi:hypothetical protein
MNKQKKSLVIELLKHFIQLDHQDLNQFILQKVTGLYIQWLEGKKNPNK